MNRSIHAALIFTIATALLAESPAQPIAVGSPIPEVTLRTDKDKEFNLRQAVAEKPAVIIFYRGGWCPYCTKHLSGLAKIENDLTAAGFQLLAVSTDQPAKLREKPEYQALNYILLSDSTMETAKAFGIVFRVPDKLVTKYKNSFGIDLEAASGATHHLLPHPAVFIVDSKGVIRFAHVNEDYKVRLEPEKVLAAAREILNAPVKWKAILRAVLMPHQLLCVRRLHHLPAAPECT